MSNYLNENYIIKHPSISGVYKITKKIGDGANTIAYEAEYTNNGLKSIHILKEYFPKSLKIDRDEEGRLIFDNAEKFNNGKEKFIASGKRQNELRMIGDLTNETPHLQNIFEFNNTVYLDVIKYEGKTLDEVSNLSLIDKVKLCLSLCKLVNTYHNNGYLCLDLKPKNIFILKDKTELIHFIDFDSIEKKENIKFGNNVHNYSLHWSAPEQRNPFTYSKISEKSDIYSLGEIIFWSLFGINSVEKNRRMNSKFDYNLSPYHNELYNKPKTIKLFTKLFSKTLRTSVDNRSGTISEIIVLLNDIINELNKKESIISSSISCCDYFVDREKELEYLKQWFQSQTQCLFITGVLGIGRSSLVKKFVVDNRQLFSNILYTKYKNSIFETIINENGESIKISYLEKVDHETDENYYFTKIKILSDLVDENTLLIIDNFSGELDNHFKDIINLNCKIIIISNNNNSYDYKQLNIGKLDNKTNYYSIFEHFSNIKVSSENSKEIDEIINLLEGHVYSFILLALQIKNSRLTIEKAMLAIREKGVSNIGKEKISLSVDNQTVKSTYFELIEYIFPSISEEEKEVLYALSFFSNGIDIKDFGLFLYEQDEYNFDTLNSLEENCLIHINNNIISVHAFIRDFVLNWKSSNLNVIDEKLYLNITTLLKVYGDMDEYPKLVKNKFVEKMMDFQLRNHEFAKKCMTRRLEHISKEKQIDAKRKLNRIYLYSLDLLDSFRVYKKNFNRINYANLLSFIIVNTPFEKETTYRKLKEELADLLEEKIPNTNDYLNMPLSIVFKIAKIELEYYFNEGNLKEAEEFLLAIKEDVCGKEKYYDALYESLWGQFYDARLNGQYEDNNEFDDLNNSIKSSYKVLKKIKFLFHPMIHNLAIDSYVDIANILIRNGGNYEKEILKCLKNAKILIDKFCNHVSKRRIYYLLSCAWYNLYYKNDFNIVVSLLDEASEMGEIVFILEEYIDMILIPYANIAMEFGEKELAINKLIQAIELCDSDMFKSSVYYTSKKYDLHTYLLDVYLNFEDADNASKTFLKVKILSDELKEKGVIKELPLTTLKTLNSLINKE